MGPTKRKQANIYALSINMRGKNGYSLFCSLSDGHLVPNMNSHLSYSVLMSWSGRLPNTLPS